jgi:sugar/nucleoside kinase (ribokinase family)
MNKGIAVAGNLTVDHVKTIDVYPEKGMLTDIRSVSKCVGGCAANTATDLAVLDPSVRIMSIGMVGDDENGRFICDTLKSRGVDTSLIAASKAKTSFTDVMTVSGSGERTFFYAAGANAKFGINDIKFDSFQADMFHIGYAMLLDSFDAEDAEFGTIMARALFCAKQRGMETSLDIISKNCDRAPRVVLPCLEYCDNLIINEIEAALICGAAARDETGKLRLENLKSMCGRLTGFDVVKRVVIHAPELCCMMDRSGFYSVPSLDLPEGYIKGTVGAGDAFCAGMLYSIYRGYDPELSLRVAANAGAACLSEENSIDGMMPFEDVMKLENKYKRKQYD